MKTVPSDVVLAHLSLTEFLVFRHSLAYLKLTYSQTQRVTGQTQCFHKLVSPSAEDDRLIFQTYNTKCKSLECGADHCILLKSVI